MKVKQVDIILMGFIALIDILIAITVITTQFFKWVTFHQILNNNWFCQFSGIIFMLLTLTSIDGVGFLSVIRALSITKDITIKPKYWYFVMGSTFCFNFILSVVGVINQIMRVMPSQAYCQPSYRKSLVSKIISIIMISQFFFMLLVIAISYVCITITHFKLLVQLNRPMNWSNNSLIEERPSLTIYRGIFIRLFFLFLMYSICFLPELITMIYNIATRTDRLPISDAISVSGINFTILVNSLFVLFYHEEIRSIVIDLLPSWPYYYKHKQDNYRIHRMSQIIE